jgi:hypothetical protein
MHPRDPNFVAKVKVILDLYQFIFEGHSLGPDDHVICADEKTSIQARLRRVTATGLARPVVRASRATSGLRPVGGATRPPSQRSSQDRCSPCCEALLVAALV